jgi:hypothetical protein
VQLSGLKLGRSEQSACSWKGCRAAMENVMPRKSRNIALALLVILGSCTCALGATQATISVSSTGVPVSGTGNITVAFSDSTGKPYSETVAWGAYSSPASLASGLAAMFTRDYICIAVHNCTSGLGAQANGATITFQLNNLAFFESPAITNPSSSFSLTPSGWQVPLSIVTNSLPTGVKDIPYSANLEGAGGQPPYIWSYTGSLPSGLQLASSGAITGTPTGTGSGTITVQVTDSVAYTYDSQGRVHTAIYATPSGNVTVTYSYDNAGNRTSVVTQ